MAFAQSRCQSGVLRGPQGRQAPLTGITMAGAEVKGRQLIAGPDRSGPVPGSGIEALMTGRLSGLRPARTA
jgi:hypothetical protein